MYLDQARQFRWRLRASNGLIIADSAEAFTTKATCLQSIALVKQYALTAQIVDSTV